MSPYQERKIHHEDTKDTKKSAAMASNRVMSVVAQSRHAIGALEIGASGTNASRLALPQLWNVSQEAFLRALRAFVVNLFALERIGGGAA